MSTLRCCRLPIMFSLILGKHPSTAPHDGTDLGEGGAEFAPTLSVGPSDDSGRDFEPRLETGLRDRVAGVSECNAGRISVLVLAITSATCEFAGLGRNRPLKDIIVCWTYTMTDPARGMGYARLYSSIATLCRRQKLWRGK